MSGPTMEVNHLKDTKNCLLKEKRKCSVILNLEMMEGMRMLLDISS